MVDYNTSMYDLLFNSEYDYGDWLPEFEKHKKAIKQLSDLIASKVKEKGEYYPLPKDVFRAFRETKLEEVKVVIFAQDGYPSLLDDGTPRAQGLAFSVRRDDTVPGSLRNMHKEMKTNFPMFEAPEHGDLTYLTKQGVLLLNSALTYCPAEPKLYLKLWRRFTYLVITILNEKVDGCVYILMGKNAEALAEPIKSRNVIISAHPSPLSAYRFYGSKVFLKTNIILKNQDKKQINWNEDENLVPTYVEYLKDFKEEN